MTWLAAADHGDDADLAAGLHDDLEDDESFDEEDEYVYDEGDYDDAARARLAAALAEIDEKFGRKPAEQVQAFADAHQALQETLGRIDTT